MGDTEQLMAKYDDLGRISNQLGKLVEQITGLGRAYGDSAIDWKAFRQRHAIQNEGIAQRRFRLAFAGGFSVGKSYLVSMFLGRKGLLPSYNKPTTGVVTSVRKGSRSIIEVEYWSRSDSDEMQRYYLNQVEVPSSVAIADGPKEVEKLRGKIAPEKRSIIDSYFRLRRAHEENSARLSSKEEVPYRTIAPEHSANPENHLDLYPHIKYIIKIGENNPNDPNNNEALLRSIKQVTLYVDSEHLTDTVELVDLPGANAADPIDTYIQHYFLKKTDGVVVVTNAKAPFGTAESAVVEILKSYQGENLNGRAFAALTMFDNLTGDEIQEDRLLKEYRATQARLKSMNLDNVPVFYLSPFVTALCEKVKAGVALSSKEQSDYDRYTKCTWNRTGDPTLDGHLTSYKNFGGMPDLRNHLLQHFRGQMVKLKLGSITRSLHTLTKELESSFRTKWEKAEKESGKASQLKVVSAIKYLSKLRDTYKERSQKFRREHILKKSFDKVFEQVSQRMGERIKLHLAGCTEAALRQEFETMGAGREPRELLRLFRERAQASILDDYGRLIWDRAGVPSAPAAEGIPPVPAEACGLLRKHVHDGYYAAVGKNELVGAVASLLPNNPEERTVFVRIFSELDLALEITTDNFVTRETLDLNEPVDSLAQGAAGFPDWAKRYQSGLTQVLTDKLQRYLKNMQGYLWNLYWKHLLVAENRVLAFLESDDVLGMVTVNIDDIDLPDLVRGTGVIAPKELLQHFQDWKKLDAGLTSFETTL